MDYPELNTDLDSYIDKLFQAQEDEINELYDNYYRGN
jgi:hypothetical protein